MSDKFLKKVAKRIKKINNAINTYQKIAKIPAMPYRAFVNMADFLFLTGCIQEAEELLNNAIHFATKSSDAFINLGFLNQSKGNYIKAIEYYKKALKKDYRNVKALCLWGNCLSIQKDNDSAIKKYQKAIEIDNENADTYLCWGITLLKKKEYKEAKEKFELAVKYNLKDARGLYMLASVEIELGLYDDALEKLIFIINSTENNFAAYHNIAYIYFKKKYYEKTITFASTALKMSPFKLETYLLLGDTYLIQKKPNDAIDTYEKAEKMNLKSLFLYLSWGTAYQKMNKPKKAIEVFNKGIENIIDEVNDEIYARLGKCYLDIDNSTEAKIYSLKATEISTDNYIANDVLADILYKEKKYNECLQKLDICLKNSLTKSKTYSKIARCHKELQNYNESNVFYEKSIEYDRENIYILLEYIESLYEQKEYEKALNKIITLEKIPKESYEILSMIFKINYKLSKTDASGYNRMKAITTAQKIKEKYSEKFCFENEYIELIS